MQEGMICLTRKARISEEIGVIWWGVCPVLPTKRRGLQRPDRDLGIWTIWMSDRMSLDVVSTVSTVSTRRPCNARVGAPSRVEPLFFLWISLDLPFQTGHRYEHDKGWRPTHPHKSHDCHLLQIGVNAKTTVQTVRTSEPLGIVLAGFCQDGGDLMLRRTCDIDIDPRII